MFSIFEGEKRLEDVKEFSQGQEAIHVQLLSNPCPAT